MSSHPGKSIVCPVLIGRARVVEVLARQIEQFNSGRGGLVLLAGDAGIGKSRLVAEARALAAQQRLAVYPAACFESDIALPYAPVLELARARLTASAQIPPPDLFKLLPEFNSQPPEPPELPSVDPSQEQRRQFQALAGLFGQAGKPCLLIVEDIHWCDDTSLEFLAFLSRSIAAQPVGLLFTYRSAEAQTRPALGHFLAELDRTRLPVELALARLSLSEVEAMIRAIFEQAMPVRADFVEAIYALSEGNPFFVEELLKSLLTNGGRPGSTRPRARPWRWPPWPAAVSTSICCKA